MGCAMGPVWASTLRLNAAWHVEAGPDGGDGGYGYPGGGWSSDEVGGRGRQARTCKMRTSHLKRSFK